VAVNVAPEDVEYTFNFDDDAKVIDPTVDAAKANAASESVTKSVAALRPEIGVAPDTTVSLPGGILREGAVLRSAEVRELTGADEEVLAKVRNHAGRFVSALLKCGVVEVGGYEATPSLLRELLIGDRDTLVMAISRATFGNSIDYRKIECPFCREELDMSVHLDSIPMKTLDDEAERTFTVSLRKGKSALVRLPTGEDQEKLFDAFDATVAEQNSILLARCIVSITDDKGVTKKVNNSKSQILTMGISDRREILKELAERSIGPQYEKVSFHHDSCDREVAVEVSVSDLFRGL
jgi:hypothetical protein